MTYRTYAFASYATMIDCHYCRSNLLHLVLIETSSSYLLMVISAKALFTDLILKAFLNFLKFLQQLYLQHTCDFSYHFLLRLPYQTHSEKLSQAFLWLIGLYFAGS